MPKPRIIAEAILEVITEWPMTATEIHQLLLARGFNFTFAGVYKNLKFLVDKQQIGECESDHYYKLTTDDYKKQLRDVAEMVLIWIESLPDSTPQDVWVLIAKALKDPYFVVQKFAKMYGVDPFEVVKPREDGP